MSTRCQIKVISGPGPKDWDDDVTLYHHCDGYPGNMLKVIGKAWAFANSIPKRYRENSYIRGNPHYYQLDRPGYVSSFLCHVDPHGFNPLCYHSLHGDIEWYFVVDVIGCAGYNRRGKETPKEWNISVYSAHIKMKGPPDLQFIMEGRISDFLTRKNKVRKEVALYIKKETEDSYIGTEVAGEYI